MHAANLQQLVPSPSHVKRGRVGSHASPRWVECAFLLVALRISAMHLYKDLVFLRTSNLDGK